MKLCKKYFMLVILFLLLNIFLLPNNTRYSNSITSIEYFDRLNATEYYDWSEIKTINQNYSFSTLYLTEQTEFKILKNEGTLTWKESEDGIQLPDITKIGKDKELIMLITNCAVNKDGMVLDVLIKIDNVKAFGISTDEPNPGTVGLHTSSYVIALDSQNDPVSTKGTKIYNKKGDALKFELSATVASCDFTMTYYIHNTYNYENNTGEYGNIEMVNGFYNDIDVYCRTCKSTVFLKGNEGLTPNVGSSIIYYNKNSKDPSNTKYKNTRLQEIEGGIAIKSANDNSSGLWYGHSALILTKDITNSTYSFSYGGEGCGIEYFFSSPYPYDIVNPSKKVSKSEVFVEEEFSFDLVQYIPNNYYANLFNFSELYDNLYSNSRFTTISFNDIFDDDLNVNKSKIIIKNELNDIVTDNFTINLENNKLIITAKKDNFNMSDFYNHTYTVNVPVALKETVKNKGSIKNITSVNSKIGDEEERNLISNEVTVNIKYKLKVNYLKEGTNEEVAPSIESVYNFDEEYTTDYPNIDGLELVSLPDNASGIIKENTIVNYYYREPPVIEPPVIEPPIENPNTGKNIGFIIVLTILLLCVVYYFKKNNKKIYKI